MTLLSKTKGMKFSPIKLQRLKRKDNPQCCYGCIETNTLKLSVGGEIRALFKENNLET